MSDYICPDLQALILKRLPPKTLLRFRSVCKRWKQLIDSNSFVLEHLNLQKPCLIALNLGSNHLHLLDPRTPAFSTDTLIGPPDASLAIKKINLPYYVVNTVHGVICLYGGYRYRNRRLFLWNPSIRHLLPIPLPQPRDYGLNHCGFWMDPSNKDFKVLIFMLAPSNLKFVLFSSSRKQKQKQAWIEVDAGGVFRHGNDYTTDNKLPQVLIGGVAHWRACRSRPGTYSATGVLIFFDFRQDKLGVIEVPEQVRPQPWCEIYVCRWRDDFLSVVHLCGLWVMRNGAWSKMFSFNLRGMVSNVICVSEDSTSSIKVLASAWNGEAKAAELILCDPSCTSIPLKLKPSFKDKIKITYDFVESLVFPDPKCIFTSTDSLILGDKNTC